MNRGLRATRNRGKVTPLPVTPLPAKRGERRQLLVAGRISLVQCLILERTSLHDLSPMLHCGLRWSEQVRVAPTIELTHEQQAELTRLASSKRTSVRLAQRAQIFLLAAAGLQNNQIAEQLAIGRVQVARWRERFLQSGITGIKRDLPRGAPPVKVDVAKVVELTTQSTPQAATHWSTRKMGQVLGVSASTVMRHWQAHGLKPHIVRGFKVSRDPKFAQKLEDIVGLYMETPEHALVLCCDEKS